MPQETRLHEASLQEACLHEACPHNARQKDDRTRAPAQATTAGRKHPPNGRQLGASTRQKPQLLDTSANHNDQTTPGCRKKHHETLREPARNPKKPQEAPRNPKNPIGHKRRPRQAPRSPKRPQGTPECPKKPASTNRPSKMQASTRPAHTTPVKKTTGHERPPRPRLLDASTPQTDDNWAQAPARNHNYWTRAPTTTTKQPQDAARNTTKLYGNPPGTPRNPKKPHETPRTQ